MTGVIAVVLPSGQAECFCSEGWTTQIKLNPFRKLVSARTGLRTRAGGQCGNGGVKIGDSGSQSIFPRRQPIVIRLDPALPVGKHPRHLDELRSANALVAEHHMLGTDRFLELD